eukprot:989242-Amphidinium_carterae.4
MHASICMSSLKDKMRGKRHPDESPVRPAAAPVETVEEVEPSEVCTTSYWSDEVLSDVEPTDKGYSG